MALTLDSTIAAPELQGLAEQAGGRLRRLYAGAFAARLIAGAALAASLGVVPASGAQRQHFGYLVAFGWIPVVGALEAISRRRPSGVVRLASLVTDFTLLGGLIAVFPSAPSIVLVVTTLVVAFHAYTGGRRLGLVAAVAAIGIVVGAKVAMGDTLQVMPFTVLLYPLAVALSAVFMAEVAAERAAVSTGLSRLRSKAEAILTGVAEAVVVTSPRGRIRQWNGASERTFGCAEDRARGAACAEVLGLHRDLERLDCSGGCALLAARLRSEEDLRVWREGPNGERQPLLAHVSPLLDDEGRVVEVVHSYRDITGLMRADEAKTMFLATTTHELKTPLTVIMGFSELLLRQAELPPDQMHTALTAIQDRSRQLSGIVDRLLMTSRIEAGKIAIAVRPVDLHGLVADRVGALRAATGRSIEYSMEEDVPDAVADAEAFVTVLDHLLENAVKYSHPPARIDVHVVAEADVVAVRVHDEGIGMTREQVEHCFERFWQAEAGDSRRFGGTGIGLYIVKSLVDAMSGEIGIESRPGAGTTFEVRLPRADRVGERVPESATTGGGSEPSIIREFMRQMGVRGRRGA